MVVLNGCVPHLRYAVCSRRMNSTGPFLFPAVNSPQLQDKGDVLGEWGSGRYFTPKGASVVGIATLLRAGRLGVRVQVEERYVPLTRYIRNSNFDLSLSCNRM